MFAKPRCLATLENKDTNAEVLLFPISILIHFWIQCWLVVGLESKELATSDVYLMKVLILQQRDIFNSTRNFSPDVVFRDASPL